MTAVVAVLVEGPTEEAFVNRVLQPHLGHSTYLTPIVVHTSRAADGTARRGGGHWRNYDRHLRRLLAEPHWAMVTTLLDYYGYPDDAPACDCSTEHRQPECVESRQNAIRASLPYDERFEPFISLYEFETLVIAAGSALHAVLGDAGAAAAFRKLVADCGGNAELIDDGPRTAPSKRVAQVLDGYNKVRDGIAILEDSLGVALVAVPHFRAWVARLSELS
ncbi:MAG: DUF4276 family protein [Micropruina sp.]|uniref:DUF4276 family protein n=1 Tax=Micropruina sp. TaxID=2737536 RepID=UPI0039E5537F